MATTIKRGLPAMHPGELLRKDIIPGLGSTSDEIADVLGVNRQYFQDLVDEKKPVIVPIAMRLGRLFGNGPLLWMDLQQTYDLERAEGEVDLTAIQPLDV
jgi:addiction module HigA family antidote